MKAYFLLSFICSFYFCCFSQGNLMVMPKRLVFQGQKRTQDVNIANTGAERASYIISFQEIRMTEDGQFQQITAPDSGQLFASPYLRVFPRTVTLEPNETQTIKVQFNRSADMKEGEYRSHLYLRAVPKEEPLGEEKQKQDSGLSIKITPVFGFTIPVIVEVGSPTVSATLVNGQVTFRDNQPLLDMVIKRNGAKTVYGNLKVQYIGSNGKGIEVGRVKGIAVYNPTNSRHFLLALNSLPGVDYQQGKLHVTYEADDAKPVKFADAEVDLK